MAILAGCHLTKQMSESTWAGVWQAQSKQDEKPSYEIEASA